MSYPQYPAHPGGVDPAPRPSGGTAITAAVLALLGGLYAVWGSISSFQITEAMSDSVSGAGLTAAQQAQLESFLPDWIETYGTISGIVQIPVVLLLLAGAILLFRKAQAGRWMILGGCVIAIGLSVASVFVTTAIAEEFTEAAERATGVTVTGVTGMATAAGGFVAFLIAVPAIATLVLVLVPPTARWCGKGQLPAMPGQVGGFGQPGGGFPQQQPHPQQFAQPYPPQGQHPPQGQYPPQGQPPRQW